MFRGLLFDSCFRVFNLFGCLLFCLVGGWGLDVMVGVFGVCMVVEFSLCSLMLLRVVGVVLCCVIVGGFGVGYVWCE